ncbi:hypothetical protein LIER_06041 [Lithospermum erythrorhizon]|uniref:Uncharacterized protein n=1 Tax=Lithospermum erythrorhizon TaxID=34254 RepID=A0AAV3P6W3_LITER
MSIPVEGLRPESMKQVYERRGMPIYFYGFLLNNCNKLKGTKFRITRLRLRYSVKVDIPGTFEVISLKRKPGIKMHYLHEKDGNSLYGVQDGDLGFLNIVSRMEAEKRVLFKKALLPGINAGFVSLETQKFHEYGEDGIPLLILVAMIRTHGDGDPKRAIISFSFDRIMEYLLD